MNFSSTQAYIDVCIEYALGYSSNKLSSEFSKTIKRICRNRCASRTPPVRIQVYIDEWVSTPTDIEDGLWFFFGNRLTGKWPDKTFLEYFTEVKSDMCKSFIPFRDFDEVDFEDAMRLRVYQDAMNIIAGRKIDIPCARKYSTLQRIYSYVLNVKPEL